MSHKVLYTLATTIALCAASRSATAGEGADLALIQGVRILPGPTVDAETPAAHTHHGATGSVSEPEPSSLDVAVGRILLHRRGCISCHQMTPDSSLAQGPRLDAVSLKLDPQWLLAWLKNPTAYDRFTRMPKILQTPEELRLIVDFVLSLPTDLQLLPLPELEADPYRGSKLFREMKCQDCHLVAGEGGRSGPALDRIGTKTSTHWLYSFLVMPRKFQPGSVSHDFDMTLQDALDMSVFLSRRFGSGGYEIDAAESPSSEMPDAATTQGDERGFAAFIEAGCLQCHGTAQYWNSPLDTGRVEPIANPNADYHRVRRGLIPPIALSAGDIRAVAAAMTAADSTAPTAGAAARLLSPRFWDLPIAAQGEAPDLYSDDARQLRPAACGRCHSVQYLEWRGSDHAGALSSGLWSQLVDYIDESPEFVRECMACHAPMTEQIVRQSHFPETVDDTEDGVTCVACHVRAHRYFGPEPRPGSSARLISAFSGGHHGGSEASADFLQSDFCSPCHQFEDGGLAIEGKLLQNTYREWRDSPHASRGQTCQSCHMPDGDHRWRGIRDREQVAGALNLSVTWEESETGVLSYQVRLDNHGAGHYLPTYATPALLVKAFLSDSDGSVLDRTLQTRIVQRRLLLQHEAELFDTRIPAGGSWVFTSDLERPPEAAFLNVHVEVDPDFLYRTFFDRLKGATPTSTRLVQQARADIAESAYILFARQLALE